MKISFQMEITWTRTFWEEIANDSIVQTTEIAFLEKSCPPWLLTAYLYPFLAEELQPITCNVSRLCFPSQIPKDHKNFKFKFKTYRKNSFKKILFQYNKFFKFPEFLQFRILKHFTCFIREQFPNTISQV